MDRNLRILAETAPASWAETIRRLDAVRSFRALGLRTEAEAQVRARSLGLSTRSFYRLVRAFDAEGAPEQRRSRAGEHRLLPEEVRTIIADVMDELGREAPERLVHLEVLGRCRAAGLPQPSYSSILSRATGSAVDLRIRLGRRCDLVLDACPLDLDVIAEPTHAPAVATLSAVLRARDGARLAHLLTAGAPTSRDLLEVVGRAAGLQAADVSMVATGGTAVLLDACTEDLTAMGVRLDKAASRGLEKGSALVPAIGRRLGKLSLTPRRRLTRRDGTAVPIALARDVVRSILDDGGNP